MLWGLRRDGWGTGVGVLGSGSSWIVFLMGVYDTAAGSERRTKSNYDLLEDITLTKLNEYTVGMNSELGILISVYSITCRPAQRRRT